MIKLVKGEKIEGFKEGQLLRLRSFKDDLDLIIVYKRCISPHNKGGYFQYMGIVKEILNDSQEYFIGSGILFNKQEVVEYDKIS